VTYLLDTNVISENQRRRPDPTVAEWLEGARSDDLFTSVVVIGELRRGVENLRRRDPLIAQLIDRWLRGVTAAFGDRILPVTRRVAEQWGRADVPSRQSAPDGLIAATAVVHGLTVVTRNVKDFERAGAQVLNPFSAA
jgi:predicted nucleic acid-binding protein